MIVRFLYLQEVKFPVTRERIPYLFEKASSLESAPTPPPPNQTQISVHPHPTYLSE